MVKEKEKNKEKGETRLLIYDVIFKAVFERVPDILIKMIRDILNIEESTDPFVFSGFESNSGVFNGKTYKGDVTIRLSDKSVVIIEMNYRKDKSVIDRNMIHLTRVLSQILKSGTPDNDLKDYRIRGLNLNNFPNDTGEVIERFAICNIKTNKIASNVYSFCNLSLEKCSNLLYDIDEKNLPKEVRWGAILLEENIDKISQILGDDMLSMEEKERLLQTIEDVNNDKEIVKAWMLEENARLKYKGEMAYAREEGLEEGIENNKLEVIKNMLNKNIDYDTISDVTGKALDEIKLIEENLNKEAE